MTPDLAEFLDDINAHIERGLAKLPAPLAAVLSRPDSGLPIQQVLGVLDQPQQAEKILARAHGTTSVALR